MSSDSDPATVTITFAATAHVRQLRCNDALAVPPESFIPLSDLASPAAGWYSRRREVIAADPARVFGALTDPGELAAWWCDEAEIELKAGGRFRFGGRRALPHEIRASTTEAIHEAEIIEVSAPARLVYRWPLGGVDTVVSFELTERLAASEIVVTQTADRPPFPGWFAGSDAADWWWLYLPALRTFIEQGAAALSVDFTTLEDTPPLRFEAGFTTFHWVVWSKLVIPEELGRWWGHSPSIALEPGGEFRLGLENFGPTRVIDCDDERRLVHDWKWSAETPASTIEWLIEDSDEHTVVSVTDHGPSPSCSTALAVYWASALLDLKQMSERGISQRETQRQ